METRALSGLDGGTGALSGLNSGTGALSGLDGGTGPLSGMDRETGALLGLDSGSEALPGPDVGTRALSGLDVGTGVTEGSDKGGRRGGRSAYKYIRYPSAFHSPRSINSSPSAKVQWVELLSAISLAMAFSLMAGVVAGSRTRSDVTRSSGSAAILSSVAPRCDGSSVAAGSGSPSSVGSGFCSAQLGDGGLGSGSGVELPRSSTGQMVRGNPFLASIHSTKAAKYA